VERYRIRRISPLDVCRHVNEAGPRIKLRSFGGPQGDAVGDSELVTLRVCGIDYAKGSFVPGLSRRHSTRSASGMSPVRSLT
jgi:hypothetical protein